MSDTTVPAGGLDLAGLVPGVALPLLHDGQIDWVLLGRHLDLLVASDVAAVVVNADTGEGAHPLPEERRDVVRFASERLGPRVPVLAGIAAQFTEEAVRLARDARAAGAVQLPLEYATRSEDTLALFDEWDYRGELVAGVVDPRSDDVESAKLVAERGRRLAERFPPERLLLTGECGFGHVPLDLTCAKYRALAADSQLLGAAAATR